MDMTALLARTQLKAAEMMASLTPDDLYHAWMGGGVVMFFVLGWVSYRIMRRALGHTKFRGTWYNAEQFETLIKMIESSAATG